MREAHVKTFSVRRTWIVEENPSAKEVMERFPRFMDMVEAVRITLFQCAVFQCILLSPRLL